MNKKLILKIATTCLAIAVVLCSAVPALAVENIVATITKTVSVAEGANAPTETYSFEIAPATVAEGTMEQDGKIDVYAGITEGLSEQSIALNHETLSGTSDIAFSAVTFPAPGIYRYLVTETAGSTAGMAYDNTVYTVDVYVGCEYDTATGTSSMVIEKVLTYKGDLANIAEGNAREIVKSANGCSFTNTFASHNLTISKRVSGNQADYDKAFDFSLTVNADEHILPSGTIVKAQKVSSSSVEDVDITVGTAYEFTLAHGESLVVKGLPEGATYTVAETDTAVSGDITTYDAEYTADNDDVDGAVDSTSYSGTMDDNGDAVEFHNDRTSVVPTGVILGIVPFAIALVGGGAYLLLKKKNNKEEE